MIGRDPHPMSLSLDTPTPTKKNLSFHLRMNGCGQAYNGWFYKQIKRQIY